MKKYLIIFFTSSIIVSLFLIFPIKDTSGFVSIKDGGFTVNNKPFYPIVLNYIVNIQSDGKSFWVAPTADYEKNKKFRFINKDSTLMQFKAEMNLIKNLGFNTVRIVGIGEVRVNEKENGSLSFRANINNTRDTLVKLQSNQDYEPYLSSIQEMLSIIDRAGLKVIFLTKMSIDYKSTENHLYKLSNHFKKNTTILAYDLFNEPLYFEESKRTKKEVFNLANKWQQIIEMCAPNHLTTIGLTGVREVFKWDPNILPFDFISYHPYEYEPEQVRNEIYWYGKYTEKPWIIGETAIPADNDSVPYILQKEFAQKTINQTFHCGGAGYSWWQYKDVEWFKFHANYMGLLSQEGETSSRPININGTVKPIADVFKNFNSNNIVDSTKCACLDNYYNYSNSTVFKLTGTLLDENNIPIEGGIILAWNEYWTHSYHTITKDDGSFELLGSYPFYHWMASATKYTMIRDEINPLDAQMTDDSIKTLSINKLIVKPLPFLK